ncbi:MAG TPA: extracellular solute-binding protein [Treponemataceae bacterium]|nr:extracellular solute-binding protein [Treponemataceae bacterium]
MRRCFKAVVLVAVFGFLVPCTIFAGGSKDGAKGASSGQAEKKITWWHIGTAENDRAMYQKFADDFMKMNPGVKIDITVIENEAFKTKITTVMQSGNPPDLFQTWGGGTLAEYAHAGLTKDITSLVKGTAWGDSMAPGVWELYSTDGKVYAAPNDAGCVTFWYNKELLAKVGYNSFPTDWDDFIVLVKKLKTAGITPIAIAGGDKWPTMYYWAYLALRIGGPQLFQDTFTGKNTKGFEEASFVKAGQMLADLAALKPFQEGFLGSSYSDQAALVGNGQAAMELMGQWAPNVQKDNSTSKVGIGNNLAAATFPAVKGGKGLASEVMGGGGGFAVGKNAPDVAIDFLKFLTNKENSITVAKTSGILVTTKGAEIGIEDPNAKMVKALVDSCTYFQLYLDQYLSPAAGGVLNDSVQAILAGTKTPAQAAAAIQAAHSDK